MYYLSSENKGVLSFAVTAKLIYAFVFAYADCWFSHVAAHLFKIKFLLMNISFVQVLVKLRTPNGHFRLILLYIYTFYSCYTMDWIANTEIGLNPNNSVIKRLWCI